MKSGLGGPRSTQKYINRHPCPLPPLPPPLHATPQTPSFLPTARVAEEGGRQEGQLPPDHGAGGQTYYFAPPPILKGPQGKTVENIRNSINTSSVDQRDPLTCLEDRAMRSGGPGSSGSSSLLSGGPVGSSSSSKGVSSLHQGSRGPVAHSGAVVNQDPFISLRGPLGSQRGAPTIQGPSQIGLRPPPPPTKKYLQPPPAHSSQMQTICDAIGNAPIQLRGLESPQLTHCSLLPFRTGIPQNPRVECQRKTQKHIHSPRSFDEKVGKIRGKVNFSRF